MIIIHARNQEEDKDVCSHEAILSDRHCDCIRNPRIWTKGTNATPKGAS